MCRGRFAFLPVACCRAAAFFQSPQGRAENAQAWGLGTSANQSDRLQIYAERTRSIAAVPPKTNWQQQICSAAAHPLKSHELGRANSQHRSNAPQKLTNLHSKSAVLQRSPETRICIANPQCRSASSQIPRICGSKFAVPQRSSPNPQICGSKFAAPQRFSVEASRLPNTARRRG